MFKLGEISTLFVHFRLHSPHRLQYVLHTSRQRDEYIRNISLEMVCCLAVIHVPCWRSRPYHGNLRDKRFGDYKVEIAGQTQ